MNLYGKKPQEMAISTLIHDTNSALGTLKYWTKKMAEMNSEICKKLNESNIKTSADPFIYMEYIKSDIQRLQDALDVYYERAKNDFK